jgi:hypothetical protein
MPINKLIAELSRQGNREEIMNEDDHSADLCGYVGIQISTDNVVKSADWP